MALVPKSKRGREKKKALQRVHGPTGNPGNQKSLLQSIERLHAYRRKKKKE